MWFGAQNIDALSWPMGLISVSKRSSQTPVRSIRRSFRRWKSCLTVHLLVSVDPQFGIHRLVKVLKGRSSRLLRQEFPSLRSRLPSLWTNSYFVATVGGAPLEMVKQYMKEQKYV